MAAAVGGGGTRRAWWMAARQLLWQLLEEEEIVSRFVCVERATCEPLTGNTSCTVRERAPAEKAKKIGTICEDGQIAAGWRNFRPLDFTHVGL